jgi:orotidine-5'-phosphate decarboxylase
MTRAELIKEIELKKSFLCVGLDTDPLKIPSFLNDFEDPIFEFNKIIIDHTKEYTVAYKPNLAFYESLGPKGWESLEKTIKYIPDNIFTIADAKRGDIGNTSRMYGKTFFEYLNFDAVTVAPYMGEDSVTPFLEYDNKWVILLGLTSNKGSKDFQYHENNKGIPLFESVLTTAQTWGTPENLMFVIGATHPDEFKNIRRIAPNNFLLVPGIGAQGGDLHGVIQNGKNDDHGLLINSSRGIIYAGNNNEFGEAAKNAAKSLQIEMANYF